MAIIDLKNCVIELRDGTGTPNKLKIKVGNGTLTYTEKRNMEYMKDRGLLDTVRQGDQEPMDVRIDAEWSHVTYNGSGAPTIIDALKNTGGASGWSSSSADKCEPYAVSIYIFDIPTCTDYDETIVLPDFRWESIQYDPKASMFNITGKCNAQQATVQASTTVST